MQNSQAYYQVLLYDFILDRLSPEKAEELFAFIRSNPEDYEKLMNEPAIIELIRESADNSLLSLLPEADKDIQERLNNYAHNEHRAAIQPKKDYKIWRWAAAAVIVIAISITAGLLFNNKGNQPGIAFNDTIKNDVPAPLTNRATITLTNGKTIYLDSAGNGQLATQGNTAIIKSDDGQLVYKNAAGQEIRATALNTLTNPRGSRVIDITLSDGTRVWLNAGSSITYPAAFNGSDRQVDLNGEAYFEVAKDRAHPFRVKTAKQTVEVLGTHFDINSYPDETNIATTLLEGSVKVIAGTYERIIKPGEQAINNGNDIKVAEVNIDNVIDWKNGDFFLNRVNFRVAMRKIARWYDVEIIYDPSVSDDIKSGGWIARNKPLSAVLNAMERTGQVHFKIEGKKVYVYSKMPTN